jgi:hypothetical protein
LTFNFRIDEKFAKYKKIAQQALETKDKIAKDYQDLCDQVKKELAENE